VIFVKRTECPDCLNMDDPNSAGYKELQTLRQMDEDDPHAKKKFSAYGKPQVRQALKDMFKAKCAYCESPTAHITDANVEHYRPKGKVNEAKNHGSNHPGYWWVGMRWENLVLSCPHCNQLRRQVIIDPSKSLEEIERSILNNRTQSVGKLDAFPTQDNRWSLDTGDHTFNDEKPLIIDPTSEDPEKHIKFIQFGLFCTAVPKDNSAPGRTTIDIIGLNRRYLTEERAKKLLFLQRQVSNVREALSDLALAETNREIELASKLLRNSLVEIEISSQPDQSYSAIAKPIYEQTLKAIWDSYT